MKSPQNKGSEEANVIVMGTKKSPETMLSTREDKEMVSSKNVTVSIKSCQNSPRILTSVELSECGWGPLRTALGEIQQAST